MTYRNDTSLALEPIRILDSLTQNHYNTCLNLNLSPPEKNDLVQYLLSLTFGESN